MQNVASAWNSTNGLFGLRNQKHCVEYGQRFMNSKTLSMAQIQGSSNFNKRVSMPNSHRNLSRKCNATETHTGTTLKHSWYKEKIGVR